MRSLAQEVYAILRDEVPEAVAADRAAWFAPPPAATPDQAPEVTTPQSMLESSLVKGQCAEHQRPWGKTPTGQIGHPVGGGEWCYQEAA